MNLISQISLISWICFAIAMFIAVMNGLTLWHNSKHNSSSSFVHLVGFIFFYFGTLGWDEPMYFWLLALLDIGTITGLLSLPYLIREIFSQSIFTHFATYKNPQQHIKLYKTKNSQTFSWLYTAKIPLDYHKDKPRPCGCGGDWQLQGNQLTLIHGNKIMAIGKLVGNTLLFDNQIEEYFFLLKNTQLTKK